MLRARWPIIVATTIVAVGGAVALTMLTTPLYASSTKLFVSTTTGGSVDALYQGNLFSQQRVVSYTDLLMGETLAKRTIAKLGLDMSPGELEDRVSASAKTDSVLIDVTVVDESPVRARDIADGLSDEFVALVRELETPQDGTVPDARVVVEQRASVPDQPVTPKRIRNIGVGLAGGLLLGFALAFVRDRLDNTVKDRQTLEDVAGVGVVGTVPLDKERRTQPAITFDTENSPIAEAFRKLRTNLQFLAVDNPPRVIVVTSSMPGEGKSVTAINIALALAEGDHSVVLVDGDLRRPRLDKYLELIGSVGFSTVLAGRASLDEVLQKTRFPRLHVLASGAVPPNPSELLGSMSAKKILAQLRAQFDYVVVDSSPLLAVTDAAILAADADGVLIITRYGKTTREQLAHSVETLQDVGAPLLGAIFTMMRTGKKSSYSYDGYYGDSKHRKAREPSSEKTRRWPRARRKAPST
jgi:receptor protein-tyrosine kinase